MNEEFDKKLAHASWPVRANLKEAADALQNYKDDAKKFGELVDAHAKKNLDHSANALQEMPTDYEPEDPLLLTDVVPEEPGTPPKESAA